MEFKDVFPELAKSLIDDIASTGAFPKEALEYIETVIMNWGTCLIES
jgi:hypothetical protein